LAIEGDALVVDCGHAMAADADESGITLSLVRRFALMAGGETQVLTPLGDGAAGRRRRTIRCRLPLDRNGDRFRVTRADAG
ncbi:MAG: hypothetical protein AAF322_18725, partial [Pseudomonadota bacterium]